MCAGIARLLYVIVQILHNIASYCVGHKAALRPSQGNHAHDQQTPTGSSERCANLYSVQSTGVNLKVFFRRPYGTLLEKGWGPEEKCGGPVKIT